MGFNGDFMWRFFVRKANKRFPFWKGALQRDLAMAPWCAALELCPSACCANRFGHWSDATIAVGHDLESTNIALGFSPPVLHNQRPEQECELLSNYGSSHS
jgi:hypothetical protein